MSASFVYVLECADNKFYVGQTTNIAARFAAHRDGKGAAWTRAHPARAILELHDSAKDDFLELAITLRWMHRHGIQNVRGGPFCQISLTRPDQALIRRLMKCQFFPAPWVPHPSDAAPEPEVEELVTASVADLSKYMFNPEM